MRLLLTDDCEQKLRSVHILMVRKGGDTQMTASTEKEEYVRIYEEIKARQAAYEAAHPGKYYLLNDYEMDDIASYHQIETLKRMAEKRRRGELPPLPPMPDTPKRSLLQACLDLGWVDARPLWQRQGQAKPPTDTQ
jgi:hypothetical protein